MQQSIKKMTAEVKVSHLSYDSGENTYKLVDDTRFTVRFKDRSSIGMLSALSPSVILKGQSGSGLLTIISPEMLGEDFLSEGVAIIELLGVVVAECKFEKYEIEDIPL
ncbi:hypothetical protein C7Y70_19495 [Pseudoalteromonas sp. KS88]|uniref:hypothetical protein n=1 Tax=Pseudoalteromonas sp. KS88 TaxID=2109918 RepID=UPI00107FDD05|nr:hypothetical protein [Pseudoalteromonas sp. KS88]TGE76306.1 hypothetical protein C7Y70_19495 [Pseudoalteromonas sp. KS88]